MHIPKVSFWDVCECYGIGTFQMEERLLEAGIPALIVYRLGFDRPIGKDHAMHALSVLSQLTGASFSLANVVIPLEGAIS